MYDPFPPSNSIDPVDANKLLNETIISMKSYKPPPLPAPKAGIAPPP